MQQEAWRISKAPGVALHTPPPLLTRTVITFLKLSCPRLKITAQTNRCFCGCHDLFSSSWAISTHRNKTNNGEKKWGVLGPPPTRPRIWPAARAGPKANWSPVHNKRVLPACRSRCHAAISATNNELLIFVHLSFINFSFTFYLFIFFSLF